MTIKDAYKHGADFMSQNGNIFLLTQYKRLHDIFGKFPENGCEVIDPEGNVIGYVENDEMAKFI